MTDMITVSRKEIEALQNLVEDIRKTHGNYTYEQAWINADEALANVNNEKKG